MFKTKSKMFYPESNRSRRWSKLTEMMKEWVGSRENPTVYNNSLRGYINVNRISIRETPYWGSGRAESTEMIMNHFTEILRYAVKKEVSEPHSRSGGGFSQMVILERRIEGKGTAKLTVGVRPDGQLVQYCITAAATA